MNRDDALRESIAYHKREHARLFAEVTNPLNWWWWGRASMLLQAAYHHERTARELTNILKKPAAHAGRGR